MTTPTDVHVSTFSLDLYFASGRPPGAAVEEHLAACGRCRAYLAMLVTLEDARSTPRVPEAPARRRPRWTAITIAASVTATALGVLFVRGRTAEPNYVGAKGTPAVELLVHRGSATWIWDGRSGIRPGDALALRVACEGMDRVAIAAPRSTRWERVTEARCPIGSDPLPFTLVVDASPGSESVAVVMSHGSLDDDSLRSAIEHGTHGDDTWVQVLVLSKEMETQR
jgi:hypothetical protein